MQALWAGKYPPPADRGKDQNLTNGLLTQRGRFLWDLSPTVLQLQFDYAAAELQARNVFHLLMHVPLGWNLTQECCIWCRALRRWWYTGEMRLMLPWKCDWGLPRFLSFTSVRVWCGSWTSVNEIMWSTHCTFCICVALKVCEGSIWCRFMALQPPHAHKRTYRHTPTFPLNRTICTSAVHVLVCTVSTPFR